MKHIARMMYGVDAAILKQAEIDEKKWKSAMPSSVRALWKTVLSQVGPPPANLDLKPLNDALQKQYPDRNQRIRALLAWYGSGAGPWSGSPA